MVPAVVTCMNKVRIVDGFGKPLGVPFKTYHAPPVKSFMTTLVPLCGEAALKQPSHGCAADSTELTAVCGGVGEPSIPMVAQLSNARVGTNPKKKGFTPSAVEPEANVSLKNPAEVFM